MSQCEQTCPQCNGSGLVPEGEGLGDCPSCDGTGKVYLHQWQILAGQAKDGTQFAKCKKCGQVEEV